MIKERMYAQKVLRTTQLHLFTTCNMDIKTS